MNWCAAFAPTSSSMWMPTRVGKPKKRLLKWLNGLPTRIACLWSNLEKEKPLDDTAWLTERSPLPIVADEAFQRLPDIRRFHGVYSGINIKLMKSTGMNEAYKMVTLARALDMKIMVGCMTETSCAVTAAAQLSPLCDWADLDGNWLISNDRFDGIKIVNGQVTVPADRPGIGVKLLK